MQIWLTYSELARLLSCSPETARAVAINERLDRKQSRDGFSRAKLNHDLTRLLVARLRDTGDQMNEPDELDVAIDGLHNMHRTMALPLANSRAKTG